MRAFKLITSIVAIFGAEHTVRADDDMEIIDLDAPTVGTTEKVIDPAEYPEPTMPDNPYGSLTLDDIVRTGTLDGVNPPKN